MKVDSNSHIRKLNKIAILGFTDYEHVEISIGSFGVEHLQNCDTFRMGMGHNGRLYFGHKMLSYDGCSCTPAPFFCWG